VVPGTHEPPQLLVAESQRSGHAMGVPHWPVASHVATHPPGAEQPAVPCETHSVWSGAQTPWQLPATQVWPVHGESEPSVPSDKHGCTELPSHVLKPGVHATQPALVATPPSTVGA
jgi:hypothetical protein